MTNVMAALLNVGGTLCSTPQFTWRPILEWHAATLPRRETRWNLQACPKLVNRSQPLVGQSSPYYQDMEKVLQFNKFFPTVHTCLSYEDIAWQSCAMVPRWRLLHSVFSASCVQHVSDLHSKRHTMCGSMVDIQSTTAEIRRGKKDRKKTEETTGHKCNGLPYFIGQP